ncbi:methyl-accepting chemotaxis protein II, partial [Klebsiella pneumoniae]
NSEAIAGKDPALDAQAEASFKQMYDVLQQSIHYLKADNYAAYGNLDAQKAQDDMEQVYDQWLSQNAQLIKLASDQNQSSFTQMQWTLGIILLIVLIVLAFIWLGLQRVLLRPLQRIMA